MKNPSSERVIREGRGEGDDEDKRTWEGRERKSAGKEKGSSPSVKGEGQNCFLYRNHY
jgi:hypothetical protein